MSYEPHEPQKNDKLKEKAAEGWEEFKNQAALWVQDIMSDRRKWLPILIVTIIGAFAFIRGLFVLWF